MTTEKELRNSEKDRNIKGYSKMKEADLLGILNINLLAKTSIVKCLRKIASFCIVTHLNDIFIKNVRKKKRL